LTQALTPLFQNSGAFS